MGQIINGHVLDVLRTMADESVQCIITSPPYWGLRDYGLEPQVWGGDPGCQHEWEEHIQPAANGIIHGGGMSGKTLSGRSAARKPKTSGFCIHCGAWLGSYGLEPTPDLYVQHTVEIFREARRVLRKDGTLWLNLGDSYCSTAPGTMGDKLNQRGILAGVGDGRAEASRKFRARLSDDLKPKDLVGIPWRVAFALQQPYYAGNIKAEVNRAWLAGIIDGEGCITSLNVAPTTGVNESIGIVLQVRMADTEALEKVVSITGLSKISFEQNPPSYEANCQRPAHQWRIAGDKAALTIQEIYPFLTVKRKQAIIAYNLQRLKDGIVTKRGVPIPEDNMQKRRLLHDVIRKLNAREAVDIPEWCIEPPLPLEPGWYLRSDVIWSKPNPMPESVTDRPTKAHEYLFLFSKQQKYYYDAQAVCESLQTLPNAQSRGPKDTPYDRGPREGGNNGLHSFAMKMREEQVNGRNLRSVWTIATTPFPGAHFATFPPALVEPCIKAGTSEKGCCPKCGAPWIRLVSKSGGTLGMGSWTDHSKEKEEGNCRAFGPLKDKNRPWDDGSYKVETRSWSPSCSCGFDPVPCVVLDPFGGSGTTAVVCESRNRDWILIELNPKYCEMSQRRINAPLAPRGKKVIETTQLNLL